MGIISAPTPLEILEEARNYKVPDYITQWTESQDKHKADVKMGLSAFPMVATVLGPPAYASYVGVPTVAAALSIPTGLWLGAAIAATGYAAFQVFKQHVVVPHKSKIKAKLFEAISKNEGVSDTKMGQISPEEILRYENIRNESVRDLKTRSAMPSPIQILNEYRDNSVCCMVMNQQDSVPGAKLEKTLMTTAPAAAAFALGGIMLAAAAPAAALASGIIATALFAKVGMKTIKSIKGAFTADKQISTIFKTLSDADCKVSELSEEARRDIASAIVLAREGNKSNFNKIMEKAEAVRSSIRDKFRENDSTHVASPKLG